MTKEQFIAYYFGDFPRLPGYVIRHDGDQITTWRPTWGKEIWWPMPCPHQPKCDVHDCLGWVMMRIHIGEGKLASA